MPAQEIVDRAAAARIVGGQFAEQSRALVAAIHDAAPGDGAQHDRRAAHTASEFLRELSKGLPT